MLMKAVEQWGQAFRGVSRGSIGLGVLSGPNDPPAVFRTEGSRQLITCVGVADNARN